SRIRHAEPTGGAGTYPEAAKAIARLRDMPISEAISALKIVLAEPLSTSMLTPPSEAPRWTIVTATKGSSSSMSCIASSDPRPSPLPDVEHAVGRVHEVERPFPMLALQLTITTMRSRAVGTALDHCDAIEHAAPIIGVRLERLDDEPLVRMSGAHAGPA